MAERETYEVTSWACRGGAIRFTLPHADCTSRVLWTDGTWRRCTCACHRMAAPLPPSPDPVAELERADLAALADPNL